MRGPVIAAVGDVHASEPRRALVETAYRQIEDADALLIAGDLTATGAPEEASILAAACAEAGVPVVAVLGNHDYHCGHEAQISAVMRESGAVVLDRDWTVLEAAGEQVGVVGLKGFVGGFPGSHLPDFGEPLLRRVYAETQADVEALDAGLQAVAGADHTVVLMHYSPCAETIAGEPEGIHAFLGCDRLAEPIARHGAALVVHGHAHHGTHVGTIGAIPVRNVAEPLIGRAYARFSLAETRAHGSGGAPVLAAGD